MSNNTNMYDIQEDWLANIAPKYFDLEDLSLNRIGLFGYVNEIMAHNTEALFNENSILYNELFFKRAILPQSIYSYASHYNLTQLHATPAIMNFAIGISEQTVLNKAITDDSNNSYFIIDSDSQIIVEGKIPFSFDYDIQINIRELNNQKTYTAKYVTNRDGSELNNPLSKVTNKTNPFIKISKIKINSEYYLFLYITCHQYEKITTNKTIYSDDKVEYFTFDVTYDYNEGQMADFNVYYKEPKATNFIQIDKRIIDSAATDTPFCYYQNTDYNDVNIRFSTVPRYFRPVFNSELKFTFFNTLGAEGNFTYSGDDVVISLQSEKYDYRDVIMVAQSTSNSSGGLNRKTYEEIKDMVAEKASTCNILSTDVDLNSHFNVLDNCSKVYFTKKRDDILDRRFGAFTLMRDGKDNIVPSNTVDIQASEYDFDVQDTGSRRFIIRCGKPIAYMGNNRVTSFISESERIARNDNNDYVYTTPFTIVVNKQPFFIEYYLPSINKNYIPSYTEVNNKVFTNFIINKIHIYRNALSTISDDASRYDITFDIIPNIDDIKLNFYDALDADEFYNNNNSYKKTEANLDKEKERRVMVVGVLYDEYDNVTHYFNCNMCGMNTTDKIYSFTASLYTNDFITLYSGLNMTGGLEIINKKETTGMYINGTNVKMGILVFMEDYDSNGNLITPISSDIYHTILTSLGDTTFNNLNRFSLANLFRIDEDIDLINNLNRLMYSTVEYLDADNTFNNKQYLLKEIPVIKYDYLYTQEYCEEFLRQFLIDYETIFNDLGKLSNAYNISLKLYNTYGKSYYFYINESEEDTLDKTNVSIHLRIRLNPNRINDTNLREKIRVFIKDYIDSVNRGINLYVSNLIKELENNFEEIQYINFKNINNYKTEVQSIEKNFPGGDVVSKNLLKEFVPEYLNVSRDYIGYDKVTYQVNIDFV